MLSAKVLKAGFSLVLVSLSLNLTACKGRVPTAPVKESAPATSPDKFYDGGTTTPDYSTNSQVPATIASATPNTQVSTFKVDQSNFNDWQAKGIAVSGGTIYVSASDTTGLKQQGGILKMNSSDGKNWKDFATGMFGNHPMDKTVEGVAISNGTLLAADSSGKLYSVDSKGSVKTLKDVGGKDVAAAGATFYVANGGVQKTDATGTTRSPVNNLTATGGIGGDNLGNVYAVSGNTIKKADSNGQVTDVITTDLVNPVDVAIDNRNGDIYVLEQANVKRFNSGGQLLSNFSSGAGKPVAIAVDEAGAVYVADFGTSVKESKVVKFSPATDATTTSSTASVSASSTSSGNDYSAYAASRRR